MEVVRPTGTSGCTRKMYRSGPHQTIEQATLHLSGERGIIMRSNLFGNKQCITIDPTQANIWQGGNGVDGDIVLFPSKATHEKYNVDEATIHLDSEDANIWIGGNGVDGDIVLFPSGVKRKALDEATIHLNGDEGDIILKNADCAEDFEIEDAAGLEPGTVLVIGEGSRLRMSQREYDKRVAGVISGAGNLKPGIILGRSQRSGTRLPVALMGRVFCKADDSNGSIEVGDLLTTSGVPGYAMKASDPMRAFGAVLGKALEPLTKGTDLIPVLVALQ